MRKLKAILFALAISYGLGQIVSASYTENQLVELLNLVELGDRDAILTFITQNPDLLNGDDELAASLKDFITSGDITLVELMSNLSQVPEVLAQLDTGSTAPEGS